MECEAHPKGWVWVHRTEVELPEGFYQYKYAVTFQDGNTRLVGDPCTRYGGKIFQNSGFVIGGSRAEDNPIPPLAGGRQHIRDLALYELNVDDFTDEYRGVRAPLDGVFNRAGDLDPRQGVAGPTQRSTRWGHELATD